MLSFPLNVRLRETGLTCTWRCAGPLVRPVISQVPDHALSEICLIVRQSLYCCHISNLGGHSFSSAVSAASLWRLLGNNGALVQHFPHRRCIALAKTNEVNSFRDFRLIGSRRGYKFDGPKLERAVRVQGVQAVHTTRNSYSAGHRAPKCLGRSMSSAVLWPSGLQRRFDLFPRGKAFPR